MTEARSTVAQVGITALNLIAPGLGLLRLAKIRGLMWMIAPATTIFCAAIFFATMPTLGIAALATVTALLFAVTLTAFAGSIILSWHHSKLMSSSHPWWSRWYGLVLAWVFATLLSQLSVSLAHRYYKPFYMPAESMAPTLEKNEKFVGDMRGGRHLAIGDLILFDMPAGLYVKRVAALAGDRIAMKAGVPVINGRSAVQRKEGPTTFITSEGSVKAQRLLEKMAGEAGTHLILDTGWSPVDDMPELTVPPGHVFVLGDNRDRSADSRSPRSINGVEMLSLQAIRGRPLFIHWSGNRSRIGERLAP